MGLKDKALGLNSGITFMEGRTNASYESIELDVVNIIDYDYLKDEKDNDYLVFITKENNKEFYFGGQVITDKFKNFDESDKKEIQKDGLPVLFYSRQSKKSKREYMDIIFYPSEDDIKRITTSDGTPF